MNKKESSRSGRSLWSLGAMAAPLAQTASECSWGYVALVGAGCLGICWALEQIEVKSSAWLGVVQWFWLSLVQAEVLHWTMYCWPKYENYGVVPLTLLFLAGWLAAKGTDQAASAGNGMVWLLIPLFGAVLLSGAKEIRAENLVPEWKTGTRDLVTVMVIPAMGVSLKEKSHGGKGKILVAALLFSVVTTGVLTLSGAERADSGFYELSRSVSLLGIANRFESLVAAAMTLGYFVLFSYLLSTCAVSAEGIRRGKGAWGVWSNAALTAMWFLWGFRLSATVLGLGSVLTWFVLPALNCAQRNLQK